MHHNATKNDNYGAHKAHAAPTSHSYSSHPPTTTHNHSPSVDGESVFAAGTGTWNGAAPRGMGAAARNAAAAAPPPSGPVNEPAFVRLASTAPSSEGGKTTLLNMPIIGMGTAALKSSESIKVALELGYRHFDCAEFYGNESLVGEGLSSFQGPRSELFVTSKVWNTHHRPDDVRKACLKSLEDLKLTYLDLYLIHWPEAWDPSEEGIPDKPKIDTTVTLKDTWQAMEALVEEGLVKSIGVSNFSLAQVESLIAEGAKIKPAVNQIELHPLLAQRKMVGVLFRKGITSVAYSPLGGQGLFFPNTLITDPRVVKIAQQVGKTPAQVLLKWNMQRGVAVIPKASSEEHLRSNIEGMTGWRLSNEMKATLDQMDNGTRFIDGKFKQEGWGDAEEGGVIKPSLTLIGK